jgi:hypothetical protein
VISLALRWRYSALRVDPIGILSIGCASGVARWSNQLTNSAELERRIPKKFVGDDSARTDLPSMERSASDFDLSFSVALKFSSMCVLAPMILQHQNYIFFADLPNQSRVSFSFDNRREKTGYQNQ